MNLSLPAAPAGSGSVGAAVCGDVWALPRLGGALACPWVRVLGGDACLFPASSAPSTWALGGLPFTHLCILSQGSWGSALEASSSLAPAQQVGMLCELTRTGNQAEHQTNDRNAKGRFIWLPH